MRRVFFILSAACLLLLTAAAPVFAAQPPRIHESGDVQYAYASTYSCDATTCTESYINVFTAQLETGETEDIVCVYTVTYPLRGRGGYTETFGCGPVSSFTLARDLSSAVLGETTIQGDTCTRRGCEPTTITVSGTFTATADASSYSYRSIYKNGDCTERYSVRGSSAPATFEGSLNGESFTGEGALGEEHYTFFSTCVY
jgi:hypothetical protein